uniref:uncharacterized protein LOC117610902 n=1 Tax=Osmia lignaria TaxID=473952 RepID=UPI0014785E7C|nr:uncharacterized protein LOC117610902 [Osmia lignaria]
MAKETRAKTRKQQDVLRDELLDSDDRTDETISPALFGGPRIQRSPIVTATLPDKTSDNPPATAPSKTGETGATLNSISNLLIGLTEKQDRQEAKLAQLEKTLSERIDSQIRQQGEELFQSLTQVRTEVREDILGFQNRLAELNVASQQATTANNTQSRRVPSTGSRVESRPPLERPFRVKPQFPSFEGTSKERPPKFLRELERFVRISRVQEDEMRLIIDQALKGVASDWWDLVSGDIRTWDDFACGFLSQFWSTTVQRKIRTNLETGYYRDDSGTTRVTYAMRLIGDARDLTPRRSDDEIVQILARHFTQAVHDSVTAQNITTVDAFLTLLDRWDNGGTVNRSRAQPHDWQRFDRTRPPMAQQNNAQQNIAPRNPMYGNRGFLQRDNSGPREGPRDQPRQTPMAQDTRPRRDQTPVRVRISEVAPEIQPEATEQPDEVSEESGNEQ